MFLQIAKVIKDEEKLRNCHKSEDPRETRQLNITNIGLWTNSQKSKLEGKSGWIQIIVLKQSCRFDHYITLTGDAEKVYWKYLYCCAIHISLKLFQNS